MKRNYLIILLLGLVLISYAGTKEINRYSISKIMIFKNIKDTKPVIIIQHEQLERMKNKLHCNNGNVLWKGGYPAIIVMDDGTEKKIPGFSFYGRFVKFSRTEWCEMDSITWVSIFKEK